jgi:hypothetical protein
MNFRIQVHPCIEFRYSISGANSGTEVQPVDPVEIFIPWYSMIGFRRWQILKIKRDLLSHYQKIQNGYSTENGKPVKIPSIG